MKDECGEDRWQTRVAEASNQLIAYKAVTPNDYLVRNALERAHGMRRLAFAVGCITLKSVGRREYELAELESNAK